LEHDKKDMMDFFTVCGSNIQADGIYYGHLNY